MYYEVVTSNGSGIHGRRNTLAAAQELASRLAEQALVDFGPFEIQQVVELPGGARRYWLREGSRWTTARHDRDVDERRPDWIWPCQVVAWRPSAFIGTPEAGR